MSISPAPINGNVAYVDFTGIEDVFDEISDAFNTLDGRITNTGACNIQVSLPESVTINAGANGQLLDTVDITTLTPSAAIGEIPEGATVTAVCLLWASSQPVVATDTITWADNKVSLAVRNVGSTSATISAIRLLVFYKS